MSDSIDLLNAIGQDASLRHADRDDLACALDKAGASQALKSAAASGERSPLVEELGPRKNEPPQVINSPAHEEEPDEDEGEFPHQPTEPDRQHLHDH